MKTNELFNSAKTFLKINGYKSIVSLGCGRWINRIDNHLRLMAGLNLSYYIGIDYAAWIKPAENDVFMAPDSMNALLKSRYKGQPHRFWNSVYVFPGTYVEELFGAHCAAVVCQRVLPDRHWEEVIKSMNPRVVLQEDLHGCERQQLRSQGYVRTWSKIRQYNLSPFRPWPIFPWENNLILWQRRDLGDENDNCGKFRRLERFFSSFIG
ncbi:MAG: hypothetical protein P8012_08755 [Desulfobacterales bacterium]